MLKRSAALLFALVFLAPPALAQDTSTETPEAEPAPLTETDAGLMLEALGHRLSFPEPDWLDAGTEDALGSVEQSYSATEDSATLTLLPEGQDLSNWTVLYKVRLSREDNPDLQSHRAVLVEALAASCVRDKTGFFQLGQDDGETLPPLGFICGEFVPGADRPAGQGEVMVTVFKRTDEGLAILTEEWRGARFDPSSTVTWPVSSATVEERARAFAAVELAASGD